jgi:cysteine desulfurase family protein (TIGR01976 family)
MSDITYASRFPGIGNGWARFDGPAGTQIVDTAVAAMTEFMTDGSYANDFGPFEASHACDALLVGARESVARLLGGIPEEIVFNQSSTANLFGLTRNLARQWAPGDEIVCTELEHDSNIAPWLLAAEDAGVTVRFASVDPVSGELPIKQFEELINDRTVWVAVTHASNATGTVPDIPAIVEIAHSHSAKVLVDAVAYVPHRRVDVRQLNCDALVTSPYKWYGPHSGVLWMRKDLMEHLPAYQIRAAHQAGPSRFEHGSTLFEWLAGVKAAADFMLETGYDEIERVETHVLTQLLEGLGDIGGVSVCGSPVASGGRTPTVGFAVEGVHPDAVARRLAEHKVAVWSGDFYAMELIKALGLAEQGGLVRAGISIYIMDEDVARLLDAVRSVAR